MRNAKADTDSRKTGQMPRNRARIVYRAKRTKTKATLSPSAALKAWGVPGFEDEVSGIVPGRKFRLDAGNRAFLVGIELQGGIWTGGAHARGIGLTRDYAKANLHQLEGWLYLQFTPTEFYRGNATETIKQALRVRGWVG